MKTVGIVGLGTMARPIARNLLAAGYDVIVWNRSPGPVKDLAEAGARVAASPAETFSAGTVLSMLSDDVAVREVLLAPSLLEGLPRDSIHINLATISADLAREAAAIYGEHGVGYISAPVFGSVSVADAGELNVLAAGRSDLLDTVQPIFDVIGKRTWRMGERPEQANIVKIAGNYLMACAIQCLGEAISLAESKEVEAEWLMELLTTALFPGPIYSSNGALIATRTYQPAGFTAILGRKDVHLALDAARESGLSLPVGEVLRIAFEQILDAGRGQDDWAVIAELQPRAPG